jgi:hypothetical protein
MWTVALTNAADELCAARMREIDAARMGEIFRIDDETVADPERRAALWRDLADGLERDYGGEARKLLAAADGRLRSLLERLKPFEAYSDPLAKKAQLFAKISERRGWFSVADPENWEVSADNVLMRLALRSGLVAAGELDEVRAATRDAFKQVSAESGIPPPELDDMLWELAREDPDLLGTAAGDLREPDRNPHSSWY